MSQQDTLMTNAPPTPSEDSDLTAPVIDYSPSTVPYNEEFENALMTTILHPPSPLPTRNPPTTTPFISANQLPIPLDSPQRSYPSPIPGLFLTHDHGYHTGGIGPTAAIVKAFAEQLIREHGVEDAGQLERVVETVMREKTDEVKARMEQREVAVQRNRGIERELENMRLQRAAELRVMEKMKGKKR
jgi:hypothetical protein